jgi:hypothetical protein
MNAIKCSRLATTYAACPPSYVRILNAYPCYPAVDVVVNGNLVAENLAYKQFAGYFTVMPCLYHIKIFSSGKHKECLIAEVCFQICPKSAKTLAIVGGLTGVLGIAEEYEPCRRMRDRCKAYVRFVNLSPNSPPLDVAIAGGTPLFENVPFTAHTRYIPVEPGTYQLQMRPAGSNQPGVGTQPVELALCKATTVYAVGNVGGESPLEVITSVDGNY